MSATNQTKRTKRTNKNPMDWIERGEGGKFVGINSKSSAPTQNKIISPQSGAQTMFLSSDADIAIYAGPRGTGKSYAGLLSILSGIPIKGYGAVVFRRVFPELTGPGSVWEQSKELFVHLGGQCREKPVLEWTFPKYGSSVIFSHLQLEKDVQSHQGKQYAQILFEELTQFTESQFWGLYASARTVCGVRPYIRATCNPDPDSFVRSLIDWWIDKDGYLIPERSGVLRWLIRNESGTIEWGDSKEEMQKKFPAANPISLTVIRATRDDNKILRQMDPEYDARLMSLPPSKRASWLYGNWNVRDNGELFSRHWFKIADSASDLGNIIARVRSWDFAYTAPHAGNPDPDWTRGALIALTDQNKIIIEDIVGTRATAGAVKQLIKFCNDTDPFGTQVIIPHDAAAGSYVVDDLKKLLDGALIKSIPIRSGKQAFAELWSGKAEQGNIYLLRGNWNDEFLKEAEAFPKGRHDDIIDAVSLGIISLPKIENGGAFVPPNINLPNPIPSNNYNNGMGDIPKKETKFSPSYVVPIVSRKPWD